MTVRVLRGSPRAAAPPFGLNGLKHAPPFSHGTPSYRDRSSTVLIERLTWVTDRHDPAPTWAATGRAVVKAMVYHGPYKVRTEEKDIPADRAPERRDRARHPGGHLRIRSAPVPWPDARHARGHTFGHEFTGVVDEVGPSVQSLKLGDRVMVPFNIYCGSASSAHAACTPTATTSTPTRPPSAASTATRTPAAATTAARPSTCACRSPTSGRASSRTGWTRRTPCCSPTLSPTGYRRPDGRHQRGRHRGGLRRRPGGAVRRQVGVADGRRAGVGRRPPRLSPGEGPHLRPGRDDTTSQSATTSWWR